MIIVMQRGASEAEIARIMKFLTSLGIHVERMTGQQQTILGIIGSSNGLDVQSMSTMEGVQDVVRVSSPYKLTSRQAHPADTVVTFGDGTRIGGNAPSVVIAGPCSVES